MSIYLIFFTITALLFAAANVLDRKTEYTQPVWLLYILPLVTMTLMYGMREGWMTDFAIYKYVYEHPALNENYEALFVLINEIMRGMGFDYHGAMTVYAAVPVFGYFFIAKLDRRLTGFIMILFMMLSVAFISNTIRWSVAGGLLFISIALLNKREYITAGVIGLCVPLVHMSMLPMLVLFWALWWFPFLPRWYYTIPLVLLSTLVSPAMVAGAMLNVATGIFDAGGIDSDLNYAGYVNDEYVIEKYFAGERTEFGTALTKVYMLRMLIYFVWFLYEGYQYVKEHPGRFNKMCYVAAFIFMLISFPTFGIELMLRFVFMLSIGVPFLAIRIINWEIKELRYVPLAVGLLIVPMNWFLSIKTLASEYIMQYISL